MDFDKIYKHDSAHGRHDDDHYYGQRTHGEYKHYGNSDFDMKQVILSRFANNPKLKILFVGAIVVILFLVVMAIILLWPLFMKLLGFLTENGIQGLVDTIWNGTKN